MAKTAEFSIDFTDLKVLNEYLNKTEKKVEMTASSAKADFKKLQMAIDPVARATKAFSDQVIIAQKALATGAINNKQYAQTFKQIQANAAQAGIGINQFGQVADVNTRKMKRFGAVGMQQVGYQVQDFAVQVQGGTSVMVALGQQGSQLLGIFGPAGAIAGMILAIGTGLAGAFMAAYSASKSATETILSYGEALKLAKTKTQELTDANSFMLSGMRSIEEFQITQAIRKLEESKEIAAKIMAATGNIDPKAAAEYANKKIDEKIAILKLSLDKLSSAMDTETSIKTDKDRAADLAKTLKEQLKARAAIYAALVQENYEANRLGDAEGRRALVIKLNLEREDKINDLRKEGLKIGSEAEKQAFDLITATQAHTLAAYDKAEAEKAATKAIKDQAAAQRLNKAAAKKAHEAAKGAAKDVLDLSKSIGSSMESAMMSMVDGTKSVSEAFKSMASEIIKELYRIYVVKKITGMITGAIDAKFAPNVGATASVAGASANGGPVQAGSRYVVGERGPEMFTPNVSGTITPNSQMGGGGVTVVQNINISTGVQQTVRAEIRQMMPQIADSAKGAVLDAKRRGGSYGRAFA